MTGHTVPADGTRIPPTGKSIGVDARTVARWDKDQVAEENLVYDHVGLRRQIGIGG